MREVTDELLRREVEGWVYLGEGRLQSGEESEKVICRLKPVLVNADLISGYILTSRMPVDGPRLMGWRSQGIFRNALLTAPDAWEVKMALNLKSGKADVVLQMTTLRAYGTPKSLAREIRHDVSRVLDLTVEVQGMVNLFLREEPNTHPGSGWAPWNQMYKLQQSLASVFALTTT